MPLKTHVDELPALNLTPMIDVMFQLILFFMVGAGFTQIEQQLDLQVPRVASANPPATASRPQIVSVHAQGQITLNGTPVAGTTELARQLVEARRRNANLEVLVRGDSQGSFQRIAEVLSACQQAGIRQLGLSVHAPTRTDSDREGRQGEGR